MLKSKHSHKLKRVNLGTKTEYIVYKCFRPGCTTYFARPIVVGVSALCWACGKDFTFAVRNLEQVKAKCRKCTGRRDRTEDVEKIDIASDNILKQLGLKHE